MTELSSNAARPAQRPANPAFSSGPCAKRPGWSLSRLEDAWLGRSHRASGGKEKLKHVIEASKSVLGLPPEARCERPSQASSSLDKDQPGRLAQGPEENAGLAGRSAGRAA